MECNATVKRKKCYVSENGEIKTSANKHSHP